MTPSAPPRMPSTARLMEPFAAAAPRTSACSTSSSSRRPVVPAKASDVRLAMAPARWGPKASLVARPACPLRTRPAMYSARGSASRLPRGPCTALPILRPSHSPASCAAFPSTSSSCGRVVFTREASLLSTSPARLCTACFSNASIWLSRRSSPAGVAYFIKESRDAWTWPTRVWISDATESKVLLDSEVYTKHMSCRMAAFWVALLPSHPANSRVSGEASCPDITVCSPTEGTPSSP
mmetsp:Transcript_12024/g.33999  ORF Transcript_12024/g.33999 Transcript_12024/m.33999 type:complete len:238 (-) Transcript_12024:307-1020(-)